MSSETKTEKKPKKKTEDGEKVKKTKPTSTTDGFGNGLLQGRPSTRYTYRVNRHPALYIDENLSDNGSLFPGVRSNKYSEYFTQVHDARALVLAGRTGDKWLKHFVLSRNDIINPSDGVEWSGLLGSWAELMYDGYSVFESSENVTKPDDTSQDNRTQALRAVSAWCLLHIYGVIEVPTIDVSNLIDVLKAKNIPRYGEVPPFLHKLEENPDFGKTVPKKSRSKPPKDGVKRKKESDTEDINPQKKQTPNPLEIMSKYKIANPKNYKKVYTPAEFLWMVVYVCQRVTSIDFVPLKKTNSIEEVSTASGRANNYARDLIEVFERIMQSSKFLEKDASPPHISFYYDILLSAFNDFTGEIGGTAVSWSGSELITRITTSMLNLAYMVAKEYKEERAQSINKKYVERTKTSEKYTKEDSDEDSDEKNDESEEESEEDEGDITDDDDPVETQYAPTTPIAQAITTLLQKKNKK